MADEETSLPQRSFWQRSHELWSFLAAASARAEQLARGEELERRDPGEPTRASRFGDLARKATRRGLYREAEYLLWTLLASAPRAPQASYLMGLVLLMQKDYATARGFIERAYSLNARFPDELRTRIEEPAVFDRLREAAARFPDWAWPRYQLERERYQSIEASLGAAIDHLAEGSPSLTFVQVGANDGQDDPLSGSIPKHGMRGLFIEPQADPMRALQELYAKQEGFSFARCAVVEEEGTVTLHTSDRSKLGTLLPSRNLQPTSENRRTETVPGRRLESVLSEHGIGRFDVYQSDTEGFDYAVLKQLDIEKHGVRALNLEFYLLTIEERLEVFERLHGLGFACFFEQMDMLALRIPEFRTRFLIRESAL